MITSQNSWCTEGVFLEQFSGERRCVHPLYRDSAVPEWTSSQQQSPPVERWASSCQSPLFGSTCNVTHTIFSTIGVILKVWARILIGFWWYSIQQGHLNIWGEKVRKKAQSDRLHRSQQWLYFWMARSDFSTSEMSIITLNFTGNGECA